MGASRRVAASERIKGCAAAVAARRKTRLRPKTMAAGKDEAVDGEILIVLSKTEWLITDNGS